MWLIWLTGHSPHVKKIHINEPKSQQTNGLCILKYPTVLNPDSYWFCHLKLVSIDNLYFS